MRARRAGAKLARSGELQQQGWVKAMFKPQCLARGIANAAVSLAAAALVALAGADPSRAAERGLADAYNRTGFALFEQRGSQPGNLVLSPLGIGTVMAMARLGARGETAEEMARVLSLAMPADELASAAAAYGDELVALSRDGVLLSVANALHLTRFGGVVSPTYQRLLAADFDAELFAKSDLAAVNDWVKEKTSGRIERILDKLDPLSVCVLLNAVYFKAEWDRQFNASLTREGDFHLADGGIAKVPFMQVDAPFRMVSAHAFEAIALPYKGSRLAMVIMLPMAGAGAYPLPGGLSAESFEAILAGLRDAEAEPVRLRMPRFKIEADLDLVADFQALGLRLAFDADRADFTGITESSEETDRLHITQLRHKTFIEVSEAGTEAAAATAVEFGIRSARPASRPFDIDRPFLFYLVDEQTKTVLFMGRVMDPRPSGS